MKKEIAIAHFMTVKDMVASEGNGDAYPAMPQYGIVTHDNVPPGTVIIWPVNGGEPMVMDVDQLTGKLTTELSKVATPHPLTSPIPWSSPSVLWPAGSFQKAVEAEMVKYSALPLPTLMSPPKPTTELIDSSNPFAKALDAWQTGKAEWVKGSLYQAATEGEPA